MFQERLLLLHNTIQQLQPACTLVAVTKYQSWEMTQFAIDNGIQHIAESRLQHAKDKKNKLTWDFSYHMIGHLQSNKVSWTIEHMHIIQSVDSLRLAEKISRICTEKSIRFPILVQCNLTQEEQKYWFWTHEIDQAIEIIWSLPGIDLQGCMCMWQQDKQEKTRSIFKQLRTYCDTYKLPICSMWMSQDREIALQEWSTMLRIWSFLFKDI